MWIYLSKYAKEHLEMPLKLQSEFFSFLTRKSGAVDNLRYILRRRLLAFALWSVLIGFDPYTYFHPHWSLVLPSQNCFCEDAVQDTNSGKYYHKHH